MRCEVTANRADGNGKEIFAFTAGDRPEDWPTVESIISAINGARMRVASEPAVLDFRFETEDFGNMPLDVRSTCLLKRGRIGGWLYYGSMGPQYVLNIAAYDRSVERPDQLVADLALDQDNNWCVRALSINEDEWPSLIDGLKRLGIIDAELYHTCLSMPRRKNLAPAAAAV